MWMAFRGEEELFLGKRKSAKLELQARKKQASQHFGNLSAKVKDFRHL